MKLMSFKAAFCALGVAAILTGAAGPAMATGVYPWPKAETASSTLAEAVPTPPGFDRMPAPAGSFAAWLRSLPMKPAGSPVLLFSGAAKARQNVHTAVIDIDVGRRDLQQCADAVMRLRAEWLYASGRTAEIGFDFTGGGRVAFTRYAKGQRPDASGRRWTATGKADASYAAFRKYMDLVFAYAGTASLQRELKSVANEDVQAGDVFIKGGFPGHAVIVADVVQNPLTKAKRIALIQSYMPAQDMHILKNPANGDGSPWYAVPTDALVTPEWTFAAGSLKRWP